jgi:YesN/AraC family two-component response regulator
LLAETELTITEIADALGYRDVFFFTRQFRQVAATPPARFRKRHRG